MYNYLSNSEWGAQNLSSFYGWSQARKYRGLGWDIPQSLVQSEISEVVVKLRLLRTDIAFPKRIEFSDCHSCLLLSDCHSFLYLLSFIEFSVWPQIFRLLRFFLMLRLSFQFHLHHNFSFCERIKFFDWANRKYSNISKNWSYDWKWAWVMRRKMQLHYELQ